MRKSTLLYSIYALIIIGVTTYFSITLIDKNISGKFVSLNINDFGEPPKYRYTQCMGPSTNPNLPTDLIPNCEQIADGTVIRIPETHIKINSLGFRDYEYPYDKPNNTFRIVILGDSITFGHGVELNDTYVKVLEKILNENYSSGRLRYEVLNLGIPGYNMFEKIEIFRERGIRFNPDLVIVQYIDDDIINRTEEYRISEESIKEYLKKNKLNETDLNETVKMRIMYYARYSYLNDLKEKKFNDAWKVIEESLTKLAELTNEKNIKVLILSNSHAFNLERIVNRYNWSILVLDSLYRKYTFEELTIHPKDGHPNSFAHRLIAEEIYKTLIYNKLI